MTLWFQVKRADGLLVGEGVQFPNGPAVLWIEVKHRSLLVYEDSVSLEEAVAEAGWIVHWR